MALTQHCVGNQAQYYTQVHFAEALSAIDFVLKEKKKAKSACTVVDPQ